MVGCRSVDLGVSAMIIRDLWGSMFSKTTSKKFQNNDSMSYPSFGITRIHRAKSSAPYQSQDFPRWICIFVEPSIVVLILGIDHDWVDLSAFD